MKIITISHQKGGVGKSTLALNLCYAFQNANVALCDTDLQGSLSSLNLMADGLNLIPFEPNLSKLRQLPYDLIIIDTPPYLSSNLSQIFKQSDLVIVPTKAGIFDMMAIRGTIELLKKSMLENPNLKTGIVFNMVKHHSSLIKEMQSLTKDIEIPVFKTHITDRVSYTRSIINGGILQSNDKNAIKEMLNLCSEVMDLLEI